MTKQTAAILCWTQRGDVRFHLISRSAGNRLPAYWHRRDDVRMSHPPTARIVPVIEAWLVALQSDRPAFESFVGSPIPAGWPEFPEAIEATLGGLRAGTLDGDWAMHLFFDAESGQLVGSGGYHAPPTGGAVGIGYEIA